ncbi:hypothetical protein QL285_007783 [Trifolium repens]|nr:hypothetical protein QL285_007783 [Trifolium repens]
MVKDSCIRRIHPHAALTIYHLSITNTSRKYDKTTNSVNTECLHTPPFRACQDKNSRPRKTSPQSTTVTTTTTARTPSKPKHHLPTPKRRLKHPPT